MSSRWSSDGQPLSSSASLAETVHRSCLFLASLRTEQHVLSNGFDDTHVPVANIGRNGVSSHVAWQDL